MKVSIIIPAHNEGEVLAQTLSHALAIEYPNFEIIVVDNASTDNTEEIARKFPVSVVREDKKGLLHARERGRAVAKGEIIANLDADCLPSTDWLSRGVAHFRDPHIVAVSGPYDYYDSPPYFRALSLFVQKNFYAPLSKFLLKLGMQGIMIGGNTLIRARVLKAVGGYNTKVLFYGEDTDTGKRISREGVIHFNKDFVMKTSGRRFRELGILKTFALYFYNFFKVAFLTKIKKNGNVD